MGGRAGAARLRVGGWRKGGRGRGWVGGGSLLAINGRAASGYAFGGKGTATPLAGKARLRLWREGHGLAEVELNDAAAARHDLGQLDLGLGLG